MPEIPDIELYLSSLKHFFGDEESRLCQMQDDLIALAPTGIAVLTVTFKEIRSQLKTRNHTLKCTQTDPKLFSGIGNAYSDELFHHVRMSPVESTSPLLKGEIKVLFQSVRSTTRHWIDLLHHQTGNQFPEKVKACRPKMAVHGKFGGPCSACSTII